MISIQTNVNSLIAQQNLSVNTAFQSKTIAQLTSGYRINQSGDDAAGLAVANKFRSTVAELTQGVANGNDATAQLQIMDGGMSNISSILDRLKTLATQSASGTFTGNRTTLNSEFQNDLAEIDRQATSIGLNTSGTFAKSLSVYLGGGSGSSGTANSASAALANSQVSLDLSKSTVDSQSLGLKGLQVSGTTDLGTGAGVHTVANVVAAATANQTSSAGFSTMAFSGAGFSGASKVGVQINLSSVSDVSTLATAINAAIQTAGNGNTQSATAFKNANIVASVHTDSAGGQELSFSSGTAAFQVEAGDQMSNAFLGNFTDSTHSTGMALNSATVAGVNTAGLSDTTTAFQTSIVSGGKVMVRLQGGGMAAPQNLTLSSDTTVADVVSDINGQIQNNASLRAAGVTAAIVGSGPSGKLTFTSGTGEQIGAQVTGDTTNMLGYGSFITGNSAGTVVTSGADPSADYTQITAGTAYDGMDATVFGTAKLNVSVNGAVSAGFSIDLQTGTSTSRATYTGGGTVAAVGAANGNLVIDGTTVALTALDSVATVVGKINGGGTDVTASLDSGGGMVLIRNSAGFTTNAGAFNGKNITVTGDAAVISTTFGGPGAPVAARNANLSDVAAQLNAQFGADEALSKAGITAVNDGGSLKLVSSNGTYFRVGVGAGNGANANIGFGVTGSASTAPTATVAAFTATDAGGVSSFNNLNGTGTASNPVHGFSFTALANGNDSQSLSFSANDATTGAAQNTTITLANTGANRSGADIDQAINYINQQLQQTNNATLQKVVAVKENRGGLQQINFISSLSSFSVGIGGTASGNGVNNAPADSLAQSRTYTSSTNGASANMSIDTQAGAQQAISAISSAVSALGTAQAAVGKGQNQLTYAISLAQSQITNFSAAESQIRDANVAQQAANLSKAQTLSQASIAAMAQANSAPQAVLSLLRG